MGKIAEESEQGIQHQDSSILSLTPAKTNEPSNAKCKKEGVELPEKYKALSELFDRMITSLRLLSLGKKASTFRNISRQVKVLTKRNFLHKHVAQIKFIFPEAVQVDRILIHNEKTSCMEPEMKISLLFDAIESHNEESIYTTMQQMFSSRLFSYISKHPKDCEIPEAELPEPFNRQSITAATDLVVKDSSTKSLSDINETELLTSSHLCPSFSRHFSTKAVDVETEKSQLLLSELPLSSVRNDCMTNQDTGGAQQEQSNLSAESLMLENPLQVACPPESYAQESTPMKLALEGDNLIIETPAQATPKRSVSSDNKPKSAMSQKLLASNISVKRSLHFSHLEGEELFQDSSADAIEQIEGETKVEVTSSCASMDAVLREDELTSHQQMPTCLSDLVSIIHHIFQSTRCPSITQQELVHKIMMNNLDVVESREVEEQLALLEKLVPDWISKNLAPSGDLLYRIKNVPDLNTVRESLI